MPPLETGKRINTGAVKNSDRKPHGATREIISESVNISLPPALPPLPPSLLPLFKHKTNNTVRDWRCLLVLQLER